MGLLKLIAPFIIFILEKLLRKEKPEPEVVDGSEYGFEAVNEIMSQTNEILDEQIQVKPVHTFSDADSVVQQLQNADPLINNQSV